MFFYADKIVCHVLSYSEYTALCDQICNQEIDGWDLGQSTISPWLLISDIESYDHLSVTTDLKNRVGLVVGHLRKNK